MASDIKVTRSDYFKFLIPKEVFLKGIDIGFNSQESMHAQNAFCCIIAAIKAILLISLIIYEQEKQLVGDQKGSCII